MGARPTHPPQAVAGALTEGIQAIYDDPAEYGSMIDDAVQRVADRIINPPTDNRSR